MLTADHSRFCLNGKDYHPHITPDCMIYFDARAERDLKWEYCHVPGQKIWVDLDFGLEGQELEEASEFALQHFLNTYWDQIGEDVIGVSLYKGVVRGPLHDLSDQLHSLAASLPDEAVAFAMLDCSEIASLAELALYLSKEHFPHIELALKNAPIPMSPMTWEAGAVCGGFIGAATPDIQQPANIGVVFPLERCAQHLDIFDAFFSKLRKEGVAFRIVPELYLTEMWDGLDTLYYDEDSLSELGHRRLRGFEVTEGELKTIRGRGI
ncbi:MAG: hypothetical protein P0S94_04720 [Simkaniaceae bacterium]|nr:hypothetical protein [Simkaniaceae bacterium]